MTTDAGRPVRDNQNSLKVGARGPVVFEDVLLFEKMDHFNHEHIPERIVHAKRSGACGYCTSNPAYGAGIASGLGLAAAAPSAALKQKVVSKTSSGDLLP